MKNPLSVAATVLKPYDSASLYEKGGQMKLQPLLEKKQKMQQAESEFAGVMAEIDKYGSDVWEQDWQQVSKMKDEFLDNAARVYEDAHFNGRDLSITERYQMQKGLGELAQKATMSKANKIFYEKTAYQIMTNPDKYDVEASMYLLNKGYKEGQLGARSVQNFMVPRFDIDAFRKKIQLPYKEIGIRGGNKVREVNKEKLIEQIIIAAQTDEGVLQRLQTMTPEEQGKWIDDEVKWHLSRGNYTDIPLPVRASGRSGTTKQDEVFKRSSINLGAIPLIGSPVLNKEGKPIKKIEAIDKAQYVQFNIAGNPITTSKVGVFYPAGIILGKNGDLYVTGHKGEIDKGGLPKREEGAELVAVPYDDVKAAVETMIKRSEDEIRSVFTPGQQTTQTQEGGGGGASRFNKNKN